MQEKQSKHPLLKWILFKYFKIMVIPVLPLIVLNVDTIMTIIQNMFQTIDPSLAQKTNNNVVNAQHTIFHTIYDNMNQYIPIISLGLFVLAFMYAMSFTATLIYQKIKPDNNYHCIEAYKQDVDKMTPVMFFILLTLSIMYSKM